MKVARPALVALLNKHDIGTSKKNKPFSNERLMELLKENIDTMTEGDDVDPLAASLAAAIEEDAKIKITGDDPTVAKQAEAPAKGKGKAEKEETSGKKKKKDSEAKPEKKKEKKESAERDKWNSSPESSAGRINAVFFANKKPLTMDQIVEALADEDISRSRVRDHLRRLVTDGILAKDDKDRFVVPKKAKDE
jgi:hypothetical protein